MPARFLRDPAPDASGGGAAGAEPPPPAPTPPPAGTVTVPHDEYKALLETRTRLDKLELERKREMEAKERERLKALADKGATEEALTSLRTAKDQEIAALEQKAQALEAEILGERKGVTIANALAGAAYSDEYAPGYVREILDRRIEAARDGTGAVVVRERGTHKPAAAFVKEWLASPAAAGFLKAASAGGAGAAGGNRPNTPPPEPPPPARNLGEAVLALKRQQEQQAAAPFGSIGGLRGKARPPA